MLLVNVIDQLLQLDFEHLGYQIRSILRLLSGQQRSLDFKPLGIVSECNKHIRATGPSANCHGILIILNHVTWTSYEKDGRMILCPMATTLLSPIAMAS
jgi:hypothetical protein